MAAFELTREEGAIGITLDGREVARYVVDDRTPSFEGRRPYLHPLRTVSGATVSGWRPWDHRWHKGLNFSLTDVSGQNFWGGNTYVHGSGYLPLDTVGSIRHLGFSFGGDASALDVSEELAWVTSTGETWLREERRHLFHHALPERGIWALDIDTTVTNVRGETLTLGSPTTNGRPDAGYSGLTLRLARTFTDGTLTTQGADGDVFTLRGAHAESLMGTRSAWMSFSAELDEVDAAATALMFEARGAAANWYVRAATFPVLGTSPSFHEPVRLAPGSTLGLSHRVVLIDGAPGPAETARLAREFAPLA